MPKHISLSLFLSTLNVVILTVYQRLWLGWLHDGCEFTSPSAASSTVWPVPRPGGRVWSSGVSFSNAGTGELIITNLEVSFARLAVRLEA
jgi:hypothetical protein